jgi:Flp pilus assembly protein TadB
MKKNHIHWMIIGCGLPLLLIFFAPALGFGTGTSLLIFILAMFACHLLMPMHHHGEHSHEKMQQNSETNKTQNHAHHH